MSTKLTHLPGYVCLIVSGAIGWQSSAVMAQAAGAAAPLVSAPLVGAPPAELVAALHLSPAYRKHVSAGGFPVIGSEKVSDYALLEAAYLINHMLDGRGDIRQALIANKVRLSVMAYNELTTTVPEHGDLTPARFWDRRARGLGPTSARPAVSCGEENLLGYPGDPYAAENILIHEFSHAIHLMGLDTVDPTFDRRLTETYQAAMAEGLWKGKYAAGNPAEYWAEGVQSWFDTNRENDHDHNHVNSRAELKEYDPRLARLVAEVFGDKPWRYQRPADRTAGERTHLEGYDPGHSPRFAWPAELLKLSDQSQPAVGVKPKVESNQLNSGS
jgi:hypothetical protein